MLYFYFLKPGIPINQPERMRYFLLSFLLLSLLACQEEGTSSSSSTTQQTPALPRSADPEAVVRRWQQHFDRNEFEAAKTLSTAQTVEVLQGLEAFFAEFGDSSVIHTNFLELKCTERGDSAWCFAMIKDEEINELYRDTFDLLRQDGRWLINLPNDMIDGQHELDLLFE